MPSLLTPRGAAFDSSTSWAGDTALVAFRGELDLAARARADLALHALLDAGARELLIDLSGLTFLDGAGVRTLADAAHCAEAAGSRLYLFRAQGQPAEVLGWARERLGAAGF